MPLTFDLPIEQLRAYQGKNPYPSDFDPFWDKGLVEMRSLDPQVELITSLAGPSVSISHGIVNMILVGGTSAPM
jgi:cephalosporin-C deacetylase-like acetyl esterase